MLSIVRNTFLKIQNGRQGAYAARALGQMASQAQYKLTYFNVRAIGEPVRYLLSYMGQEFEDVRLSEEWPSAKSKLPFGKLPVLEVAGETFYDSSAICRYLGEMAELTGNTREENLRIDQTVGAFNDLITEVRQMYNCPDIEKKAKLKQIMLEVSLPFYLERFDKLISSNGGYLANNKLSWADLYVTGYCESLPVIFDPENPLKDYKHLQEMMANVTALPGVARWIQRRPDSLL